MLSISRRFSLQLRRTLSLFVESYSTYTLPLSKNPTLAPTWSEGLSQSRWTGGRNWFSSVGNEGKERETLVIYKGRWMVPFYVLVRLKVIQLVGLGALVLPINTWLHKGVVDASVILSSGFVAIGCTIASLTLWYFSKRYIGALALMGSKRDVVRFSVMNFWGTRTEEEYSLDSVIPPLRGLTDAEKVELLSKVLIPLDVIGGRQYFFSAKHGYIVNKELLTRLLDGSLMKEVYALEVDS